ncbi:MAG: hypothetical protein JW722_00670 [Demequinaceae bacterium]|nr:hypothetical protein [Demequinaceae bacterium]
MSITRRAVGAASAIAMAFAAVVIVVTPANAINPCASQAQIRYSVDDVQYRDPSLGCAELSVQFQYQPPSSGTYYFNETRYNLVQGVTYNTPNRAEIAKARACTGQYCAANGWWSAWWTTSLWYTFG